MDTIYFWIFQSCSDFLGESSEFHLVRTLTLTPDLYTTVPSLNTARALLPLATMNYCFRPTIPLTPTTRAEKNILVGKHWSSTKSARS